MNQNQIATDPILPFACELATIGNAAKILAPAGETESAIRARYFKAKPRINSRGETIPGNGLIECGAVVKVDGKVLVNLPKYCAYLARGGK